MKITKHLLRRIIRESLISEQVMWHSTAPENVEAIMSKGLQSGRESANTMAGAWADEFYGKRPIYLSVEKGKYEGTPLAVNAAKLDLVADLPTLVDTGAYQEEEGMYWDEGAEPQQMLDIVDEDGMVYYDDLLSPGSAAAQAAIEITGTAAVIDGVPPESIALEDSELEKHTPSAAESEWASKSQAEKDDHVKNAVWETMAWKRYRKHAQAEGIPFDPDDEEDMKVARAWWKEQPESKQFESKMIITKQQLRRLLREQVLLAESEMLDIIVNPYEDVEDYNILANYALNNDIQGALADPTIKQYVDKNEMGWIADEAGGWFGNVGKEGYDMPAPEGWDSKKAYKFLRDLEDAAWKVYDKQMTAAIANDPDREFLEFLGNAFTSTIEPNDMEGIKWKEYKKYVRLKPPPSISHGVGEITVNRDDVEGYSNSPGTYEEFIEFMQRRAGGDAGRRPPYKKSPPPYYD